MPDPLRIAQVTPYAWESDHEVNVHVARLAAELRSRGHRVVVLAPSRDIERVRASRALIREGRFGEEDVLFVGEVLPELPTSSRRRAPGLPVDLAREETEKFIAANSRDADAAKRAEKAAKTVAETGSAVSH